MLKTLAAILVTLALNVSLAAQKELNLVESRIDEIFSAYDQRDSPGCALGIIEKQRLVLARGYGQANLEYGLPLNADSVFRIGSTSKQFTAMSIQLLAHDGRLSLDDDIRKYVPELPDYGQPVRVRHLIHHTSGLRDYLRLMSLAGLRDADFYTDEQVLAILARQRELNFLPGEEFLYSNSGYFLLAEIVNRVSGQSLREFAQERILDPLGMTSSHFHNDHQHVVPGRASGYRRSDQGFKISMTTLEMIGDGGLFTTVRDLARWDANFYTGRVGGMELIRAVQEPGRTNGGAELEYASGLMVSEYRGLPSVRHGGSFVGFRAELLRFPEQQVSIICLCNLAQTNPSRLADQVADVILEGRFVPADEQAELSPKEDWIPLPPETVASRQGAWESEDGQIWKLTQEDSDFWLVHSQFRSRLRFSASRPEVWRAIEAPILLEMEFSSAGEGILKTTDRQMRLRSVELAEAGSDDLAKYAGRYTSPELDIEVELSPEDGGLRFRNLDLSRDSPRAPFQPTIRHRFDQGSTQIIFVPSSSGRFDSFRLNAGRVRNILFFRQASEGGQ